MSTSNGSTIDHGSHGSSGHCGGGSMSKRGNWAGMNIAVMVIAFILFWPIGLFILYWIASGRHVSALPNTVRRKWDEHFGQSRGMSFSTRFQTGNTVFDAFQQTQYDRIREIKEEIKLRAQRFQDFKANKKRREDEEEFNSFMASAPIQDNNQ